MKTQILATLLFLSFLMNAEDSLQKLRLKPHDLQHFFALTAKEGSTLNIGFVNSFTQNEKYHDPAFYAGYSDTTRQRRNFNHHRNDGVYKNNQDGKVYAQTGINMSFRFENTKSGFLRRLKPNLSLFHSSRRFFAYNIRAIDHYNIDTVFYQNPNYPPIIYDSLVYRNIYYRYSSQQIYAGLGASFDLVRSNAFVFYTGIQYGFGHSYNNEFHVQKDHFLEYVLEPFYTSIERNQEPPGYSSRITVPVGVQVAFTRRPYNLFWIYADMCPGYETYRIKGGRSVAHGIWAFTWGLKFQFS